jgi:hypothetical protein
MWRDSTISRVTKLDATKRLLLENLVRKELLLKILDKKEFKFKKRGPSCSAAGTKPDCRDTENSSLQPIRKKKDSARDPTRPAPPAGRRAGSPCPGHHRSCRHRICAPRAVLSPFLLSVF